ncbi:MAG: NapC/NirT family cytochrome c, partial [Prolixibacteraceae bacterium]|nr:NapC/NirT family cytochrome c [Prolixibacteraceae bacterium]
MLKNFISFLRERLLLVVFLGFIVGIVAAFSFNKTLEVTSTTKFCESCHVHPHVFDSWKLSSHYDTKSGMRVECVDCHLPPKGEGYVKEKVRLGVKDFYGYLFKDSADFNWEARRGIEMAQLYTFQASCLKCHPNLFTRELSDEGMQAHLYYSMNEDKLNCLNCHIEVGHYDPNRVHSANLSFGSSSDANKEIYAEAAAVEKHESFTETIPGTSVSFNMIAISGGSFQIGSPADEQMRNVNEGPTKTINISPFFMAEVEVTWNEFLAFYSATAAEGRSSDTKDMQATISEDNDVDAISGPTPPYGQPDQNWGMGSRPAITMSFHAAETYCRWLSQVTGKTYRLPTEAEWEFAARGGTQTPYFFQGQPKDFAKKKKKNTEIDKFIIY